MLRRHGTRIAFCADELYLIAGLLGTTATMRDFDQLGNGWAPLLSGDEFASALAMEDGDRRKATSPCHRRSRCRTAFCGALKLQYVSSSANHRLRYPPTAPSAAGVNVTGLVCGRDIIEYLRYNPYYQGLILPGDHAAGRKG